MFICYNAIKLGWRAGYKPLIGLDECFLKGITKGQILVAVEKDAMEKIFPIV